MSMAEQLKQLAETHQGGGLTDQEFRQAKETLLRPDAGRSRVTWRDAIVFGLGAVIGAGVMFVILFALGTVATSLAHQAATSQAFGDVVEVTDGQLISEFANEDDGWREQRNKRYQGKSLRVRGTITGIDRTNFYLGLSGVSCHIKARNPDDFAQKVKGLKEGMQVTILGRFGGGSHEYTTLGYITGVLLDDCVVESHGPAENTQPNPPSPR